MNAALLHDTGVVLTPDPKRVVTRLFVPGREGIGPGDSRAGSVVDRILALDEADVLAAIGAVDARFGGFHLDLDRTFRDHAELVMARVDPTVPLSDARVRLLGASFTNEYAIEGAALCNPSAVLHPDGDDATGARFVLSVRGIGEGHRSSIGFRVGRVTSDGAVTVDAPGPHPRTGEVSEGTNYRSVLHALLAELGDDREDAAFVLDALGESFGDAALAERAAQLTADLATRGNTVGTIASLSSLAELSYRVRFPDEMDLSERVLWPSSLAERQGMEDARFVRFTHDDGSVRYYGTYTAFDGVAISQQLLETDDFVAFDASPMAGEAARGKGLALFPRPIGGRFAALSRADRETNAVAFSDDLRCWDGATTIQMPERPWEILQLGNCGSPIETAEGWLVLTHGVGPMRTYAIGALLLDLDDPRIVLASSQDPIVIPSAAQRGGYVPNVVYSCGGFAYGDVLVLPYGVDDESIAIATFSLNALLASMRPVT